MCELTGRVVLLTGGGRGIGAASVAAFAAAGATVVTVDRDWVAVEAVALEQVEAGHDVEGIRLDVTDADAVNAVVEGIVDRHGRIDVLHNNAGVFRFEAAITEFDQRTWDVVLRVNTLGTANMCRAVIPHMVQMGRGAIVNTSSAQARLGDTGWTSYAVAKAGVEALTRSIATQFGPAGIRCNAVAPGLISTEEAMSRLPMAMVEGMRDHAALRRLGKPSEIADVVVFLASDRAGLMTGQVLHLDGGLSVGMPHLRGRDSA